MSSTFTKPTHISLKTILVAVDFSQVSDRAMDYARSLARRYNSTIIVAHVISPAVYGTAAPVPMYTGVDALPYLESIRRDRKYRLEELAINATDCEVKCVPELVEGAVAEQLVSIAETRDVDLIAIGSHGTEGWNRLVMGSVAESISHSARCPVLTVGPRVLRRPKFEASFKHIIYATDFSADSAHAALYALSLAEEYDAKITLVHVLPPEVRAQADSQRLTSFFKSELEKFVPEDAQGWCEPEFVLEFGGSVEAITELAEERGGDLIVLGTRKGHDGMFTYFKSGVAYQVISRAECPVFTVTGEQDCRGQAVSNSAAGKVHCMNGYRYNLVKVLETELRFLDNGGYRNPDMWRPRFPFLDSPTCVHRTGSGRPEACSDCPLIGFVPDARRNAPIPCHHIPLTKEGFTVDSLFRWGTQEELENALRGWLIKKIQALSGNNEGNSIVSQQPEEVEEFCTRMAG